MALLFRYLLACINLQDTTFPNIEILICNDNDYTSVDGISGLSRLVNFDAGRNKISDIQEVKVVLKSVGGTLRQITLSRNPVAAEEYYIFHLLDASCELTHVDHRELGTSLVDMLKIMSFEKNWEHLSLKLNSYYTETLEATFFSHENRRARHLQTEERINAAFDEQLQSLNTAVRGIVNYMIQKSETEKALSDGSK